MSVNHYEDLEIWKAARILTRSIYRETRLAPFCSDYGLIDQIRRAAVSVMSNIAEGYERDGNKELTQFLSIAKGSCGEVRCQLYVALDQDYISKEVCSELIDSSKKLSIMINNFMRYLKGSPMQGVKFKKPRYKPFKEEVDEMFKRFQEKQCAEEKNSK